MKQNKIVMLVLTLTLVLASGCISSTQSSEDATQIVPTIEPTPEQIKTGIQQEHAEAVSKILSEAGYSNSIEAEGAVMFVSLYDSSLTLYEAEELTRALTQYVFSNAGTGTATVLLYVNDILVAEGKYKIWSGSIEVDLKR